MEEKQREFIKGIFFIALFVCFVWKYEVVFELLGTVYQMIQPLIYGGAIAFVLNLIVRKLEKHMTRGIWKHQALKRGISIFLSVVIAIGVISAILVGLIPELINSVKVLEEKLPAVIQDIIFWIEENVPLSDNIMTQLENFSLDLSTVDTILKSDAMISVLKTGGNVIGGIIGFFTKFFMGLFFAFYILAQKEDLGRKVDRFLHAYMKEEKADNVVSFFRRVNEVYSGFISGQCLDACLLGLMMTIAMFIFQMPFPVLIGVIIALTALVPVVGAFVGGGIGMFLIAIESPFQAILFLILFLVLQQLDNQVIYPHVVGNAVGLPSIWIFVAIVIGGKISGVLGMFLGIPVAALIYAFLGENLREREREKVKIMQEQKEEQKEEKKEI